MIILRKAKKKDKPLLIEYKLLTITPYLKKDEEKLKVIADVSNDISTHFEEYILITYFLKPIGAYLIKDNTLETFYIEDKYQKEKQKVLKKITKEVKKKKIGKERTEEIKYLNQKGWKKEAEEKEYFILRKDEEQ